MNPLSPVQFFFLVVFWCSCASKYFTFFKRSKSSREEYCGQTDSWLYILFTFVYIFSQLNLFYSNERFIRILVKFWSLHQIPTFCTALFLNVLQLNRFSNVFFLVLFLVIFVAMIWWSTDIKSYVIVQCFTTVFILEKVSLLQWDLGKVLII